LGAGLGAAAAAGTTLGASIATGAAFGTAIPIPVVGTALGALVGLGVGMLGTWAFNKDGNAEGFRKLMEVCKAPGASKLVKKMSNGDIRSIAYAIQDSKGTWNDDEDTIAAELGKIQTIADLCAVDKKVPGGLFEFLGDLTDDPDEWKLFTRPIEGMIEDSEVLLTPEEQKKTGGGGGGGSKKSGLKYNPCSGTYKYGCKSDTIAKVQGCLGLVTDGKFGPKTQSALLEAMQERQVTIGRQSFNLPKPFFVMATANPIEQSGVYTLPEAQLDRFLFKIIIHCTLLQQIVRK
jgi:hypothetical protein